VTIVRESEEEYLGAIYRLRDRDHKPLPLSRLSTFFHYSPVSVHEMIQKLVNQGTVIYHPYYGVTLTDQGEEIARALLRRHRLWERFLTDTLNIPWEDAHEIADRLEHASTNLVTERLSSFLGNPDSCPHGESIPPAQNTDDLCLNNVPPGSVVKITRISPETPGLLHRVQDLELLPGYQISVLAQSNNYTKVSCEDRVISIDVGDAQRIWAEVM
jgi:DtxR family Mn-dependent transcriptional regulator